MQSYLFSIPSYFLLSFKISKKVVDMIEKKKCIFLWSGRGETKRDHLSNWDLWCWPNAEADLGLRRLVPINIDLAGKWLWLFPLEPHSLWYKVI